MRVVFVIITGLTLMAFITVAWYVSQAVVTSIAHGMFAQITSSTEGAALLSLTEFANIVWGPIFDGIILFWMFSSAKSSYAEGETYG